MDGIIEMIFRKAVFLLAAISATLAAAESEPATRQMDFSIAGIALGIPAGYLRAPLIDTNQIFHFVWIPATGEQDAQTGRVKDIGRSVSLWAFSAGPGDTAKEFLEDWTSPNEQKLDKVKILIATHIRIDGLDGLARSTTYRQAGNEFSTATVCFIRDMDIPASIAFQATGIEQPKTIRLAYILRLELPESQKEALLPTLDQIVKTITFTDLRRPVEVPLEFANTGELCLRQGLIIREITGWFPKFDRRGVTLTQPDFILDGTLTPSIRIGTCEMTSGETLENIGLADIEKDSQAGKNIEIISQGRVGNAFQFVLHQSPGLPATQPTTQPADAAGLPKLGLEIRRFMYNPTAKPGQPKCLVLTLAAKGCDVATAERIMESLATGILPAPTTKPAAEEKTTCASQPATVKSTP